MSEVRFFEVVEKRRDSKNELVDTVVLRFERDKGLTKTEKDATEEDKKTYSFEFNKFESANKKEVFRKGKG